MANNWTTAVSESDFVTLTNGASPALLDHTALIAAGVTKCTDRKAVLRKTSKFTKPAGFATRAEKADTRAGCEGATTLKTSFGTTYSPITAYTMADGVMVPNDGTPATGPTQQAAATGGGGGKGKGKTGGGSATSATGTAAQAALSPKFEQRAAAAEAMASSLASELTSILGGTSEEISPALVEARAANAKLKYQLKILEASTSKEAAKTKAPATTKTARGSSNVPSSAAMGSNGFVLPAPAMASVPALSVGAVAKWLAAVSMADFQALNPLAGAAWETTLTAGVTHDDLILLGMSRCTDRKAVLRRTAKIAENPFGFLTPAAAAAAAAATPKKKGAEEKKQAAAAAPAAGGGAVALSNNPESILAKVTAQGLIVRGLKTAKADKAEIKTAVGVLMALKKAYKDATGIDVPRG
eukprot:gene7567-17996_t